MTYPLKNNYNITSYIFKRHIIQTYLGITCGRVLNGELYTQRLQKITYLCLINTDKLTCHLCLFLKDRDIALYFEINHALCNGILYSFPHSP